MCGATQVGKPLMILWKDQWFEGSVIDMDGSKVKIHYKVRGLAAYRIASVAYVFGQLAGHLPRPDCTVCVCVCVWPRCIPWT